MRLDPAGPAVRHRVGHRLSIAADLKVTRQKMMRSHHFLSPQFWAGNGAKGIIPPF